MVGWGVGGGGVGGEGGASAERAEGVQLTSCAVLRNFKQLNEDTRVDTFTLLVMASSS